MAIVQLTVRRERKENGRGINKASEVQGVNDAFVKRVIPSVCKKEGVSDGLVNAMVEISDAHGVVYLWTTETVSTILTLS